MSRQTLSRKFGRAAFVCTVSAALALLTGGFAGCAPETSPASARAEQTEALVETMQRLHERLGALDLRIEALADEDPREPALDGLRDSLEARVDALDRRAVRAARGVSGEPARLLIEDAQELIARLDAALADARFDLVPLSEDAP